MRREYELTKEQFDRIIEACKPVPYIVVGGMEPRSPQENANDAWCALGREMGFDGMSVQPSSRGDRFFSAEVVEPPPPPDPHLDAVRQYDREHGGGR
jgi:hypothetical protein